MGYGHWEVTEEFNPEQYFGFVYEIIFENGKRYIGSKQFVVYRHKAKNQWMPSNWKSYKSSSKHVFRLLETIKARFIIRELYLTKSQLMEAEYNQHVLHDVANNDMYLNRVYAGKYHNDFCKQMSACQVGKTLSEEHKKKLSDAKIGVPQTFESREAKSKALKEYNAKNKRTSVHAKNSVQNRKKRRKIISLVINGISYKSKRQACIDLDVSDHVISSRIDSDLYPNYVAVYENLCVPHEVIIDNKSYTTYGVAAEEIGVSQTTIMNRCKSKKFENYTVIFK